MCRPQTARQDPFVQSNTFVELFLLLLHFFVAIFRDSLLSLAFSRTLTFPLLCLLLPGPLQSMGQLDGNHLVLPFVLVLYSRFFNVTNFSECSSKVPDLEF